MPHITIAKKAENKIKILALDLAKAGRFAPIALPINVAALRDKPNGNVSKSSPIETTKT